MGFENDCNSELFAELSGGPDDGQRLPRPDPAMEAFLSGEAPAVILFKHDHEPDQAARHYWRTNNQTADGLLVYLYLTEAREAELLALADGAWGGRYP